MDINTLSEAISQKSESSILLSQLDLKDRPKVSGQSIFEHNAEKLFNAASFTKLFLALELSRRLNDDTTQNKTVIVTKDMLAEYGQDVLADLFGEQKEIQLDLRALIRLMLKYSCNSSTVILARNYLPPREELQRIALEKWELTGIQLVDEKGEFDNKMSMRTIFELFGWIFSGKYAELINALEQNINTYYMFDSFPHKLLASKTAAFKDEEANRSWIGNAGVFEVSDEKYFAGAMIAAETSDQAVEEIRELGQKVAEHLNTQ